MKNLPDWLEQKFKEWEKMEGSPQTYYTFARYLEVGHSSLALWISGAAVPQGDDLARVASKLGSDIYDILKPQPSNSPVSTMTAAFESLPAAFQSRLASAVAETAQAIAQNKLNPESAEAKHLAVRIFEKWGFKITG